MDAIIFLQFERKIFKLL